MSNKPAPFTDSRNKITIYKITVIYAAFYVLMKLYSIVVENLWVLPNLIISIPIIIIGLVAFKHLKEKETYWWFIIISIIVVSAVRYFEADWVVWLNQNL